METDDYRNANITWMHPLSTWVAYLLLGFPLFYFVYKFGDPSFGCNDFFDYYPMYKNLDIKDVDAPFNMRLVSSFFVYIFNKLGFNYNTECAFDRYQLDRQVFFNAVLFNFICVVTTCCVIFTTLLKSNLSSLASFSGGLLYLFGFGTIFYEIMPLTDSLSVLLFALTMLFYLKKSLWLTIPLILLILQREYIFLAIILLSAVDYLRFRIRYFIVVGAVSVVCLLIYYVLRKTIFYTPVYDRQASPTFYIANFFVLKFPLFPYVKQLLMTMNLYIVYILIIGYKYFRRMHVDWYNALRLFLLFLQINLVSFAGGFGNNAGRIFYLMTPIIIFYLVHEALPLFKVAEDRKLAL